VNLDTVKAEPVVYYDRFPSTTVALSQVNLLAQVQGYLTGIFFKEGTHVKKGQKLYDIDSRIYQNSYNAAVANLRVAQGTQTQSQEDADRYTYLNNEKAVAKQLYDHAIITLQNSKSAVQAAAESVKTARQNLNFSVITAPFDGTIGFSQVKLGDLMNVGTTILNTISTDDPMAVDFLVNEKQLPYFEDLKAGKGNNIDSLFTLILPNNSFYPHNGQISVIDRAVDPQTGSVRVRLVFPNPDYYLRAGMSCVVRVRNQDNTPQILIPNKAIVEQMGEYFVFVVKDTVMPVKDTASSKSHKEKASDSTKNGHRGMYAFQKKVQTGATIGPNVIIKGGLNQGDLIVKDGVQSLHDGSEVTTSNKVAGQQANGKQGSGGGGGAGSSGGGK
jgi:membrane fusion protein (multidrug efflux system)